MSTPCIVVHLLAEYLTGVVRAFTFAGGIGAL